MCVRRAGSWHQISVLAPYVVIGNFEITLYVLNLPTTFFCLTVNF